MSEPPSIDDVTGTYPGPGLDPSYNDHNPFRVVMIMQRDPLRVPENKPKTVYQWGYARRVCRVLAGEIYTQIFWVGNPQTTKYYPGETDWQAKSVESKRVQTQTPKELPWA